MCLCLLPRQVTGALIVQAIVKSFVFTIIKTPFQNLSMMMVVTGPSHTLPVYKSREEVYGPRDLHGSTRRCPMHTRFCAEEHTTNDNLYAYVCERRFIRCSINQVVRR